VDKQRVSSRNSDSLLEQRYIDKILNQEGKAIWKAQKAAISKYGLKRHTGQLQDKLSFDVWIPRFNLCQCFRFVSASDFGSNCATLKDQDLKCYLALVKR